jgi:hypothetical protein
MLSGAFGAPCEWLPSSESLICTAIVEGRGAAPSAPATPLGPVIQESDGRVAPNRTYEDLLRNAHDEALFEHYFTGQLLVVPLQGPARRIGSPAIYSSVDPSPDGRYLLTEVVHRPYSYLVPVGRFPERTEVLNLEGRVVRLVHDRGLLDNLPTSFDAVAPGPRAIAWRTDAASTVVWAEAQDGGDPGTPAPLRDQVMMLAAPFTAAPARLAGLEFRARTYTWVRDDLALIAEGWRKTRRTRTWAINPSNPAQPPRLVFDYSSEDRYRDPGRWLTRIDRSGYPVLLTSADGRFAFLEGQGASAEGDRPFLDRMELATGKTERLWRSEAPYYEQVVSVVDPDAGKGL